MQGTVVLNQYTLQRLKVKINSQAPYHDLTLQKDNILLLEGCDKLKPNTIKIEVKLTISEALNYCLKRTAAIAKLWIKSTFIGLILLTKEG
jgi:hypothetical protein